MNTSTHMPFVEPQNLAEAKERRDDAQGRAAEITTQLGGGKAAMFAALNNGQYESEADYLEWRRRAKGALAHTQRELRDLKRWISHWKDENPVARDLQGVVVAAAISHVRYCTDETWDRLESAVAELLEAEGQTI